MVEEAGDVSSSESAGVSGCVKRVFGRLRGEWEKRRVCLVVGEIRKGRLHGFCVAGQLSKIEVARSFLP